MNSNSNGFHSPPELSDPLVRNPLLPDTEAPDRLFYATGVLLDAADFQAEQLYHRSQLARALSYLHGSGTVVGLNVPAPEIPAAGQEEELVVEPGLAIDRLGRLIEVPHRHCIRVKRWLQQQGSIRIYEPGEGPEPNTLSRVIADVFLRFVPCERGRTPALATGPYDALDAVMPSRIRDGYELTLVHRAEDVPGLPQDAWSDLASIPDPNARRTQLHQHLLNGWNEGSHGWNQDGLNRLVEHLADQNPTALFLARVSIPVTRDSSGNPERTFDRIQVNNEARSFVYSTRALAHWLGL